MVVMIKKINSDNITPIFKTKEPHKNTEKFKEAFASLRSEITSLNIRAKKEYPIGEKPIPKEITKKIY